MRRREFIAVLGGAAAWPVVARAQQSGKIPRVGVLWHAGNEQEEAIYLGALRQGLRDVGYIEGKNIELLNRFADEQYDRFDALATELVAAKVNVIVAIIPPSVIAAKKATSSIPIVFIGNADPVGLHHVNSLAHPGGNLTGLSGMFTELTAKQLGILKNALPSLTSVALLTNPSSPLARAYADKAQTASLSANVKLSIVDIGRPDELTHVFSTIAEQKSGAAILSADGMLYNERKQVADLAIAHRLPTIGAAGEMAEAGLLMSYGPEFSDLFRRAGVYIDKILKGTKPADIPVELPTKFNLVVNLTTARAIGVTIPDSTQLLAERIIE